MVDDVYQRQDDKYYQVRTNPLQKMRRSLVEANILGKYEFFAIASTTLVLGELLCQSGIKGKPVNHKYWSVRLICS